MRLLPKRDYVILRQRPELIEQTTSLKFSLDEMPAEQAALVGLVNSVGFVPANHLKPVSGGFVSDPEALGFGEVVAVGPGHPGMPEDRPGLQKGDIVGYRRSRVAREIDDFETGKRESLLEVHEHGIPVRYHLGAGELPEPLSNWVLTRPDPIAAQKALGRMVPLTDEEIAHGVVVRTRAAPAVHKGTSRERAGSQVATRADRALIERVVATGPGRWVKAVFNCAGEFPNAKERWVPNDTHEGELLLLMGCAGRMRFVLHGRRYSLIPWNECGSAIEESLIVEPAAAWAS